MLNLNSTRSPAYVRSTMDGCFFRGRESFHQAANVNCVYREMIQPWEPNLIDQCKEAYRQGCILAAASGQCQRGEQHSSQSGACSAFPVPHDQHPMSYLRRCCDACVGGQNYYDHNSTCPTLERPLLLNSLLIDAQSIVAKAPLTFESESAKMLQETFIRCCAAQRNQVITKRASNLEAFIDEDNEKQFWDRCSKEHKCEHLCIDSGEQETHCACNPGFVLSSDLRSCIRISPCPGPYCAEQTSTVSSQKRNLNEDNSVEEEEEEEPAEEDWKGRQVKSNATSETESKLEHDSIDTNSTSNDINSLNTTLIGHTNTPTVSTESSNQTITKTVVTNSTKLDDDNKQLNQFKCVNGTYDPYLGACDPTDPPSIVPQMMSTLINRRVDGNFLLI